MLCGTLPILCFVAPPMPDIRVTGAGKTNLLDNITERDK